jgi:hypothetical protein
MKLRTMLRRRAALRALCALLPLLSHPRAAGGQAIGVAAVRGLAFGTLTLGVPRRVTVFDLGGRGEFRIDGRGGANLQIVLPSALVAAGGETIPLTFGSGDAAYYQHANATPVYFDPRVARAVTLGGNGNSSLLHIGGMATPAWNQGAGAYSAQIAVIVTSASN